MRSQISPLEYTPRAYLPRFMVFASNVTFAWNKIHRFAMQIKEQAFFMKLTLCLSQQRFILSGLSLNLSGINITGLGVLLEK